MKLYERRERQRPDDYFADWKEREALAEGMIPLVGKLYRKDNVKTYIYGHPLVNRSVIEIMRDHRAVRQIEESELSEFEIYPVLQALAAHNLGHAHVDVGRIAAKYFFEGANQTPAGTEVGLEDYVRSQVEDLIGSTRKPLEQPQDVVLYGFGRIGRLMARLLIEKTGGGDTLRLRAIVVRKGGENDLIKRASLLETDSVHGRFNGTVRVDEERCSFVANGNEVRVIYASEPDKIDYTQYGINNALVIDNTGKWRDREGLGLHLKAKGTSKVMLTAPGKGDIKNIVAGINDHEMDSSDTIVSAASCTTNAITPPLKAIDEEFGVEGGHVETVHAYTNDQNLIDNYHKGNRRGRSAALNMVLTETGAVAAVGKVLPALKGKLSGSAIRVPTPNVSMAMLNLRLARATTIEELNEYVRIVSLHSPLRKQIDYINSAEAVSTDFVGSRTACVFDAQATKVDGKNAVLYIWYDNEFGYACQVHRVIEKLAGVKYELYPRD
ncbi:MAG: glyceraldehyde-3-phosphate dehydrogenase [Pseudomonadales bacterium]|nr:glyceraldehyde-3-phosphate dehydrogenase [Pseudomonadales bacterium]